MLQRHTSFHLLPARLVLLVCLLAASGCLEEIEAPRCVRVEDCPACEGYRFCRGGYCFERPVPPGTDPDAALCSAGEDVREAAPPADTSSDAAGDTAGEHP